MKIYIIRKAVSAIFTVILVSLAVFWLFQIVPGDPVLALLGDAADPALEAALREQSGLGDPPLTRYLKWVTGVMKGDLGNSLRYFVPVTDLILDRLPNTLALSGLATLITVFIGVPLGIAAAWFSKNTRGAVFNIFTQLGASVPPFFLAVLLIILFSLKLGWFNVISYVPWNENPVECVKGLFLPSLAIAVSSLATLSRYTRTSVMAQLSADYVRTARGKGIKTSRVVFAHVLRNAALPIVTWFGIMLTGILSGVIVVEAAFTIPGIGNLLYGAIKDRDVPLAQGISLYITITVLLVFFTIDILYRVIDPRVTARNNI